jgi:predicted oxidoreductase (fatty acid repression mutant protein)
LQTSESSWKLADSFNSTTIRYLLNLGQEVSQLWSAVDRAISYWIVAATSKVERDIKLTAAAAEFVVRRVGADRRRLVDWGG